jgi:xanthine/CO dehydrogenase XdhC/CoxF family maturation factor
VLRWHNCPSVEAFLGPLLPLYQRERNAGRALAIGMLVHTAGSTYRKAGALMLIAADGDYSGLLSGGCLEGDLREHSRAVIANGEPRTVRYDLRERDDPVWGLGLGCEGAMEILLLRAGPDNDWQPLSHLARALEAHAPTAVGVVIESTRADLPVGALALPPGARRDGPTYPPLETPAVRAALGRAALAGRVAWVEGQDPPWKLFVVPLSLPPRILLLGAGPDAAPVVDFAARLDWKVTLVDHRPAYAVAARFPAAESVVLARPDSLPEALDLTRFSAAVVMSHHLPSDLAYLRALAASAIPYVGLLGPLARREKLLSDLGAAAHALRGRLRAPVGLALGGRSPESIALGIVAELHAFVHRPDSALAEATLATPVPAISGTG